ncbi:MAG: hypothetical protein AVDCRST_MAG38-2085, partial [uncultured Solirubrobacteraceae bacterium]
AELPHPQEAGRARRRLLGRRRGRGARVSRRRQGPAPARHLRDRDAGRAGAGQDRPAQALPAQVAGRRAPGPGARDRLQGAAQPSARHLPRRSGRRRRAGRQGRPLRPRVRRRLGERDADGAGLQALLRGSRLLRAVRRAAAGRRSRSRHRGVHRRARARL